VARVAAAEHTRAAADARGDGRRTATTLAHVLPGDVLLVAE
jgi:hypothetical protein